jgi:hypothetical protein
MVTPDTCRSGGVAQVDAARVERAAPLALMEWKSSPVFSPPRERNNVLGFSLPTAVEANPLGTCEPETDRIAFDPVDFTFLNSPDFLH